MRGRTNELENYHELKFSREQGFFDKTPIIRVLIWLLFTASLFFILHFREVRVDIPELGSIAPGYAVAQVDFDFPDEEASAILRQEAVRDIGKIYRIQDKEIRQRRIEFENFLIYNQEWRRYVERGTFEVIYNGADAVEKLMLQLRFSDPRTIRQLEKADLSTTYFLVYTPPDITDEIILPPIVWQFVKDSALPTTDYSNAARDFIISFFQINSWSIEEDIPTQRLLRKRVQAAISEKWTHVSAGSRILDQGEKVTTRHIAMLQAMKKTLSANRNLWSPLTVAGDLILAGLLAAVCIAYFHSNHPQVLSSNRKLALIVTIIILTLILGKIAEFFALTSNSSLHEAVRYPVVVAFAAILLCSLTNSGIATFASGFLTLVLTMTLAFERQGFMILNLAAALVAILTTHALQRRKEIFLVCAKAWLCCVLVIFAMYFSQNIIWNNSLLADIISTGIFMLLTAIAVVGLLPLLESTFRVMTNVSLTEYMDPNNDLLRRLTIEAPGTYQHSVVVGNIAEAAAVAIGANGLFCRVATLYHDIGKMATPQYFTENQEGGVNIHQLLTPLESAAVIIAHVSEGVSLARKAGLPEPFIDIIKEHHGTTLVYYFYRKQLEKMHGDTSKVNEADFRYAGPTPRSKESGIIMIADSLEAASRSLEKIDEHSLMELAHRLVQDKLDGGQFDHCLLTLEELSVLTSSLVKTLVAFAHSRVKYPSREVPKVEPLVPPGVMEA